MMTARSLLAEKQYFFFSISSGLTDVNKAPMPVDHKIMVRCEMLCYIIELQRLTSYTFLPSSLSLSATAFTKIPMVLVWWEVCGRWWEVMGVSVRWAIPKIFL
jgi:hypothetical protein